MSNRRRIQERDESKGVLHTECQSAPLESQAIPLMKRRERSDQLPQFTMLEITGRSSLLEFFKPGNPQFIQTKNEIAVAMLDTCQQGMQTNNEMARRESHQACHGSNMEGFTHYGNIEGL
jgi:hypothetical protein